MDNYSINRKHNFKKLASQRTNGVLEKLRILGNLSNKSYYSYSDQDIQKIFSAIEEQTRLIKAKFKLSGKRKRFKL